MTHGIYFFGNIIRALAAMPYVDSQINRLLPAWTGYEKTRSPPGARNCSENLLNVTEPTSLDPVYLKWTKSNKKDTSTESTSVIVAGDRYIVTQKSPLFILIITDAFVDEIGDVMNGMFKLVMNTCEQDFSNTAVKGDFMKCPVIDELFIISQCMGF
jgi:hypothetical protein